MRTSLKLAAFSSGLVLAFGAALGIGAALGTPGAPAAVQHDAHGSELTEALGGLTVAEAGYRLELAATAAAVGLRDLRFTIVTSDGPLTAYETSHAKDLHLIVVRRDLTGFQHVHPVLGTDGVWSTPVDLTAGTWRVFADFVPAAGDSAGNTVTLGADLEVGGRFSPAPLPAPAASATVDGYVVTLTGRLVAGQESSLRLGISKNGTPVTDLQPYLAAYGHLLALRVGDLGYLHAHPVDATSTGPEIVFDATAPTAGAYRLFLDFRHGDTVRTAEFTVVAEDAGHS